MLYRKILSIATVISVLFSGCVSAQTNDKVVELMNLVKVADGYVNKKLHEEFWAEVKKSVVLDKSGTELKEVEASLQDYVLMMSAFPLEGWRSAKLSLEQKRIVRTPELVRQTNILKAKRIPAMDSAITSTDKLLEAAATGKPLSHNGTTMYINDKAINQVLDGMDASLSRLKVLTNPVWSNEMQEQIIKSMDITVLSHERFSVSRVQDGPPIGYAASRNAGELQEQLATINFSDNYKADLDKAVQNGYQSAIEVLGLSTKPRSIVWNGLEGLTAVAPFAMQGKAYSMAIQVVKRQAEHSVLMTQVFVEGSPADASLALDNLLQRIKLN